MRISFFEEYPTEENMEKLHLVRWGSTLLIAAPSLGAFESIKSRYAGAFPHITFGWWPTVPGSYWVSGLSDPKGLDRLFSELTSKHHDKELPILIDLELPIKKGKWLRHLFSIGSGKKKISAFLKMAPSCNLKIYTAEYPALGRLTLAAYRFLGISFPFSLPHTKLPMYYSSMFLPSLGATAWKKVQSFAAAFSKKNPERVGFGLGTTAVGVQGNEPIISMEQLAHDLRWAQNSGAKEVFIFRLGGLDGEQASMLQAFAIEAN